MPKHRYLMPPEGYKITELIRQDDEARLRSLAHEMVEAKDKEFHQAMDAATLKELQKFFTTNDWSFETKPTFKKLNMWPKEKNDVAI